MKRKFNADWIRVRNENRNKVEWFTFTGAIIFGESMVSGKISVSKNNIGYFIEVNIGEDSIAWRFKYRLFRLLRRRTMKIFDEQRRLNIVFDDIKAINIQKQWKVFPNVLSIYENEAAKQI